MWTRLPLFALLFVLLAVGLLVFGPGERKGAAGVAPGSGGVTQARPAQGDLPRVGDGGQALGHDAKAPSREGSGAESSAEVERASNGPSPEPPLDLDPGKLAWLERYGELEVGELHQALRALRRRFERQCEVAFEDRFTLGQFESTRPGELAQPIELSEDGRALLSETRTGTNPETLEIEARCVVLPLGEFGDLYALREEIAWLATRIGE
jgi:hypothetical protein